MTVRAWPRVRAQVIAVAIAGVFAGTTVPVEAWAHPFPRRGGDEGEHAMRRYGHAEHPNFQRAAPAPPPIMRAAAPSPFDEQRTDGHMTPEERRLLRQHIEDAVRELYKR